MANENNEKPTTNYYDDELNNIDLPNGEFKSKVQHHGGASTKWMNVNSDSIPAVIRFLQKVQREKLKAQRSVKNGK